MHRVSQGIDIFSATIEDYKETPSDAMSGDNFDQSSERKTLQKMYNFFRDQPLLAVTFIATDLKMAYASISKTTVPLDNSIVRVFKLSKKLLAEDRFGILNDRGDPYYLRRMQAMFDQGLLEMDRLLHYGEFVSTKARVSLLRS